MKTKLVSLLFASAVLSSSAFAQVLPYVHWNLQPTVATAFVSNPWGRTLFCEGRIVGLTASRFTPFAYFRDYVPAGQYRIAVIHSNPYDVLIDARSEIRCW